MCGPMPFCRLVDPSTNRGMNIELEMLKRDDTYANFIGSIRNGETRHGYTRNLKKFLDPNTR